MRNSGRYQSPINGAFETIAFHSPGVNAWAPKNRKPDTRYPGIDFSRTYRNFTFSNLLPNLSQSVFAWSPAAIMNSM